MSDVEHANHDAGGHFFTPEARRWFGSRIGRTLYGGRWFVSSELNYAGGRTWKVRRALANGRIETESEHATPEAARREATRLARDLHGS